MMAPLSLDLDAPLITLKGDFHHLKHPYIRDLASRQVLRINFLTGSKSTTSQEKNQKEGFSPNKKYR